MTTVPDHGPAPIDASLHLLVDHLIDALEAGDLAPALLHVSAGDAEGFDLGMLPLEDRHPSELLVGFTAPEEWHALGVATGGWAYHTSERGSAQRRRTRVHVVSILSRTGELAHRTRIEDETAIGMPTGGDVDGELPGGEQVDLLRLALGLATDEPPCGTDVYWAIRWLSEILGMPAAELTDWPAVERLHPARLTARQAAGPGDLLVDSDFVDVAAAFGRVLSWTLLRDLLVQERFEIDELVPADGAWFDDGAFARFLLNRCPPLAMLRRQIVDHLPPPLADRVLATLELLGIPDHVWPDHDERAA